MNFDTLDILLLFLLAVVLPACIGLWIRRSPQHADEPSAPTPDENTLPRPGFIDSVPALNPTLGPAGDVPLGPLVTVAAFSQPHEAHLARLQLEQHGIPAFVADENLIGIDWFYSLAAGGVKVQVPESVAAEAHQLLHEASLEPPVTPDFLDEFEPEPDDPDAPRCPACGSLDAYRVRRYRAAAYLSLLLLNFPLPLFGTQFECGRCGTQWKAASPRR